jgi:hypothetical protein
MPVNIYRVTPEGQKNESLAWLCDGEWLLSPQIDALSAWLEQTGATLPVAEYVADVGFCWRRRASGGGPVLEPTTMRRMADLGMRLVLSEYSFFEDEEAAVEDGGASE